MTLFILTRTVAGGPRERRDDHADLQTAEPRRTATAGTAAGRLDLLERDERYVSAECTVAAAARLSPRESQVQRRARRGLRRSARLLHRLQSGAPHVPSFLSDTL